MGMEEDARSGDSSEVVVKSRNASGCLIVRKACNGMVRAGASDGGSSYMSKERKRDRIMGHSGEELYHRKEVFRTNPVFSEFGDGQRECAAVRSNFEHGEGYRKRRRSSDFVESVEYGDGREEGFQMDRGYNGAGSMYAEVSGRNYLVGHSPVQRGVRGDMELDEEEEDVGYRRMQSDYMAAAAAADGSRRLNYYGDRNRYSNGSYPPGSANFTLCKEYIRIQGKNGVLRVKVSKLKGTSFWKTYGHLAGDVRIESVNEDMAIRNKIVSPSAFAEPKHVPQEQAVVLGRADKHILKTQLMPTNRSRGCKVPLADTDASLKLGLRRDEDQNYYGIAINDEKNNRETEMNLHSSSKEGNSKRGNGKGKQKLQSLPTESDNGCDSQSDNGGFLKLGTCSAEIHKFDEGEKIEENRATPLEKCTPTESKDGKQKRGSGTEKQKLREHIRKMLLDSGWKINYRPRRNRDYQDAVYVSPAGTAYWSIVKAYEGLQKQFAEDNCKPEPIGDGSQFSPVADDILNKLTRQTRKKMEKEMKKKVRNGEGSGNLQDGVSKKSAKAKHVAHIAASNEGSYSLVNEAQKSLADNSNENFKIESQKANRKQSSRTLLVRSANRSFSTDDDAYVPYTGKRTLLSWLIDCGSVKLNEKVQYMNHKQAKALQQGWISRDGIHCLCCSKIVTISKFELHAGSKVHQPLQSIFLESGVSLLQCLVDAWNKQTKLERDSFHQVDVNGDDRNDDICGICGDGGDLICCDGCPSTFHQNCLGVEILPPGEWHCPNCVCTHCGLAADKNTQGSDGMCSALLACNLCEKKHHLSCIRRIESDSFSSSFCDSKCEDLYEALQKFVRVKHDLGSGFSWSIIHRTDIRSDVSLSDLAAHIEGNCKLAVTQEIMDECFLPIVDQRSGINMIHHVIYNYGSNFNRLNYSKFYTAILERGDEMMSAASLRFHGDMFAELPFIGTRHIYRHQGMCRRLFNAIETALLSFKVKKLVIPAISELMRTWTEVFRFNRISESDKKKFRSMNILVFPGVDLLQKVLSEQKILKASAPSTALKSTTHDRSPIISPNSNKEQSAGSGHDDGDEDVQRIQPTKNQGDTSASDSDSESDSDQEHVRNTSHPTSPLNFPPRISVVIGPEDDTEASRSQGSDRPKETYLSLVQRKQLT